MRRHRDSALFFGAITLFGVGLFGAGIGIAARLEPTPGQPQPIAEIETTTEPLSASPTTMIMTPKRQAHRFVPMTTPPGAGYGGVGAE